MEKFYAVILEDVKTGDGIRIECKSGLAATRYLAEKFTQKNGIKILSKIPARKMPGMVTSMPANKREVVWACKIPLSVLLGW